MARPKVSSFTLPVTRFHAAPVGSHQDPPFELLYEQVPAHAIALPVSFDPLAREGYLKVTQKSGGTEASPLFTVAHWGHGPGFSTSEVVRGIRIERVAPGRRVLVPLPAARTQITGEDREGVRHALLWPGFPRCGVGRLYDASPHTVDTPTCPDCLLLSSGPNMRVWETVYVQPYDSREKRKREEAKEARAQRQRARFPTAFDKLLEDVFDPEAIPEPPPVFSLDPDMLDPTEDYQDERARKLASARRRER